MLTIGQRFRSESRARMPKSSTSNVSAKHLRPRCKRDQLYFRPYPVRTRDSWNDPYLTASASWKSILASYPPSSLTLHDRNTPKHQPSRSYPYALRSGYKSTYKAPNVRAYFAANNRKFGVLLRYILGSAIIIQTLSARVFSETTTCSKTHLCSAATDSSPSSSHSSTTPIAFS